MITIIVFDEAHLADVVDVAVDIVQQRGRPISVQCSGVTVFVDDYLSASTLMATWRALKSERSQNIDA